MKCLIIFLNLLLSFSVSAETTSATSGFATEYSEEFLRTPDVTSEHIRESLKMELLVLHGYEYREVANQLSLGFYINPSNIISLRVGKESTTEFGTRQTSIATQWKHFFTNNMYLTPELYFLKFYDDVDASKPDDQITAIGTGVRFGSQWQWKYLTIGCDWLGIGYNLAYFKNETNVNDTEKLSFNILNAYVGLNF